MKKQNKFFGLTKPLIVFFLLVLFTACSKEEEKKDTVAESYKLSTALEKHASYDEGYPMTDKPIDTSAWYKSHDYLEYYKDYYKDKIAPPPFDYTVDLSKKSFQELRLLRAEILARHGYLFMDYVSRSHFNATKWYQPVFWDNNFQIHLSEQEQQFIDKVLVYENKLYKNNYIGAGASKKANTANVVNWQQFEKVPAVMLQKLTVNGFAINSATHEQLFHVYDQNYYDYTPSFITTDLYLQVLHMHISKEMQALEVNKLFPLLDELLNEQYETAKNGNNASSQALKQASGWNQVYYAVALSLLKNKTYDVPSEWEKAYDYEYSHTKEANDYRSDFLGDSVMDYTQFIARGNYTRSDSLKQYFKCVKWLNSASIYLDENEPLSRAVVMGYNLSSSPKSWKSYTKFSDVIGFLAGEENNLSFAHLQQVLQKYKTVALADLLTANNLEKIRQELYSKDPRQFGPVGVNDRTDEFVKRKKLLFTAGRYTFDAEILQKLVHVKDPQPLRPFPKGLDIFAAMGNETAEDILLHTYKEQNQWPAYEEELDKLKGKFHGYKKWNNSVYSKQMEAVLSLEQSNSKAPYFMKLPAWRKKNLNTMLASWTELKHDMVLYAEQPSGAEMGNGGEVPPPQKIAYVEPNVAFWNKCQELLALNKQMLEKNEVATEVLLSRNKSLEELVQFLLKISEQELNGTMISNADFDQLSYMGGQIEQLTLNIIESQEAFVAQVSSPERYVAVATDVYTYKKECLQEGVGMADEIYVIAEINGLLYLTKGAVFSHYEFVGPSSNRLTDEAWQKQLLDHKTPKSAVWMNDIKVSVPAIKTAPNFNLY